MPDMTTKMRFINHRQVKKEIKESETFVLQKFLLS